LDLMAEEKQKQAGNFNWHPKQSIFTRGPHMDPKTTFSEKL